MPIESQDSAVLLPEIDEKNIDDTLKISIPQRTKSKNICESIAIMIAVTCIVLYVARILCKNFKIPFDYDPNLKSKHLVYKRARNKKFKKR